MLRFCFLIIFTISLFSAASAGAQPAQRRVSVAILDFGDSRVGRLASEILGSSLGSIFELNIVDRDLARSAARGVGYSGSLNLSLAEAQSLGAALGSDFYFVGDSQTLRRSPSSGAVYFESYASIFLVSSRTGSLVLWQRPSFQSATSEAAEKLLLGDLSGSATRGRNFDAIRRALNVERMSRELALEKGIPLIEEAPDDESTAEALGLRLPRPYRRLRPPYPETAASAEAEATVDVLVDLDAKGEVGRVEIARWAGFGLDEATVGAVRQLRFFPAMRNGTPIPLRVLLRYNFRKPAR
jgi:TonB family protein